MELPTLPHRKRPLAFALSALGIAAFVATFLSDFGGAIETVTRLTERKADSKSIQVKTVPLQKTGQAKKNILTPPHHLSESSGAGSVAETNLLPTGNTAGHIKQSLDPFLNDDKACQIFLKSRWFGKRLPPEGWLGTVDRNPKVTLKGMWWLTMKEATTETNVMVVSKWNLRSYRSGDKIKVQGVVTKGCHGWITTTSSVVQLISEN